MPTGYTADVGEGKVTDFRTFALHCARGMGACIMQRDDPANEPPKLQQPDDYHLKAIPVAQAELDRLMALTVEEAATEMEAERQTEIDQSAAYATKRRETKVRYEAMLKSVEAWVPPTPDHRVMKEFMIEQLIESIKWDCSDFGYQNEAAPVSPTVWLRRKRTEAARDVEHHKVEHEKEVERTNGRNAWIQALYDSLPAAP